MLYVSKQIKRLEQINLPSYFIKLFENKECVPSLSLGLLSSSGPGPGQVQVRKREKSSKTWT